jgi:Protein of unknown function (DUF1488)
MTINCPNRRRSYDATRRAARFWAYDRSMEASFFMTAEALTRLQPNLQSDAVDLLRAFDANRDRVSTQSGPGSMREAAGALLRSRRRRRLMSEHRWARIGSRNRRVRFSLGQFSKSYCI